jgi:hypothetical protein
MTPKTIVCAAPKCPRKGLPFTPRRADTRTCSKSCRDRLYRSENTGHRLPKSHKASFTTTHGANSEAIVAAEAKNVLARIEGALPPWDEQARIPTVGDPPRSHPGP